ncbi:MAG: hypothetical protein M1835_003296 [Candelina submexicana]|nr:MAG: hypothetical protein M1835_003296 [Candelina submexicana]
MTPITLDAIRHYDPLVAARRSSSSRRHVTSSKVAPVSNFIDAHATNVTPVWNITVIKDRPETIEDDEFPPLKELLFQARPHVSSTDNNLTPYTVTGESNWRFVNGSQGTGLTKLKAGPGQDAPAALDSSLSDDAKPENWQSNFSASINDFEVASLAALGPIEGHGAHSDSELQPHFTGSREVSSDEGDHETNIMAEHGSLAAVQPIPACSSSSSNRSCYVSPMRSCSTKHSRIENEDSKGAGPLREPDASRSPILTSQNDDDYDNTKTQEMVEEGHVGPGHRKR